MTAAAPAAVRPQPTQPTARSIAVLVPDWPVAALRMSLPADPGDGAAIAILRAGSVIAASQGARRLGVEPGRRKRDAQAAAPQLLVENENRERDERRFHPLVARIEAVTPGVQILRPGLALLRARGPARFYGGELEAARVVLAAVDELAGVAGLARIGIADSAFAAEQAARSLISGAAEAADGDISHRVRLIGPDRAPQFLAPLPVTALDEPDLAALLARLGVHTLGQFAALSTDRVRERFGEHGVRLHALASGAATAPFVPRTPPPQFQRVLELESPLEHAEQIAFAVRRSADDVVQALGEAGLVCTEISISLLDERGGDSTRRWMHPSCFDAPAIVDRVRWQLQSVQHSGDAALRDGVIAVHLTPVTVDSSARHQPSLLGQATDARLHHSLSRVQSMLGHDSVRIPFIGGGRRLSQRQRSTAWGDRAVQTLPAERPWPGHLPDPLPATVFPEPVPVLLTDDSGAVLEVDDRGFLSARPVWFTQLARQAPRPLRVQGWAGPWPLRERTWNAAGTVAHRLQIVLEDQSAWLVLRLHGGWHAEGAYD